jgi:hypothetical protein
MISEAILASAKPASHPSLSAPAKRHPPYIFSLAAVAINEQAE